MSTLKIIVGRNYGYTCKGKGGRGKVLEKYSTKTGERIRLHDTTRQKIISCRPSEVSK